MSRVLETVVEKDGVDAALEPILYILATIYGAVAVHTIVKLYRLHKATRTWTRQKLLHYLVLLCTICRFIFFILVPAWDGVYFYVRMTSETPIDVFLYILEEAPTLLFLTIYSQQLLVWAQSYHTATNTIDVFKYVVVRCIIAANIFVYVTQIMIWILYHRTAGTIDPDAWSLASASLHAIAFMVFAFALLGYGWGVRKSVQVVPVGLQLRVRQMRAVVCVTATCSIAFLARGFALVGVSYAAFLDVDGFDDALTSGDLALSTSFFLFTELVPLVIVLRHNGTVPGSRNSSSGSSGSGSSRYGRLSGGRGGGDGASGNGSSSPYARAGRGNGGGFGGSILKTTRSSAVFSSPSTARYSSSSTDAYEGGTGGGKGGGDENGSGNRAVGSPGFRAFTSRIGRSLSMSRGLNLRLGFRSTEYGEYKDVEDNVDQSLVASAAEKGGDDRKEGMQLLPYKGGSGGGSGGGGGRDENDDGDGDGVVVVQQILPPTGAGGGRGGYGTSG